MNRIIIVLLILTSSLVADVKSTTGQIKFDTQMDNQDEMTLNSTGLGIGITPSTNLHVNGNAIVTNQIFVGGSSGSSNLNVNGTIGYGFQTVTSSTTLSGNSIVLADTSSGNIVLSLPEANSYEGRQYTIKKTSILNNLSIRDGGFIDNYSDVTFSFNNMGSLSVISSSGNWYILNISDNVSMISTDNLVGWWKFDETSGVMGSDSSPKGFDATHTNLSSANIGVLGKFFNAISFDGQNDYSRPGANSALNWGNGDGTISLWFKTSADYGTSYGCMLINGAGGALQRRYLMHIDGDDDAVKNTLRFDIDDNTSLKKVNSSVSVNDGLWHHAVGIRRGNELKLYLDGSEVLDGPTDITGYGDIDDSEGLTIGATNDSLSGIASGQYFNGELDDIRVYNRALSEQEIAALYSQGN